MNALDYTATVRLLRHYYNEVVRITEELENGEITIMESEEGLIALDERYARKIMEELQTSK